MKYFAGIDLGGTTIKGGIVDAENRIICSKSIRTLPERGFEAVAEDIAVLFEELVKSSGLEMASIEYLGAGSPGAVDVKTGKVFFSGNLGWENAELGKYLKNRLGKDVYVGNDASCAALGEFVCLEDKSIDSMAMMTVGTGVGFGLILGGHMYSGATYGGGEFGHTTLVFAGEQCTCGKKGCIEAYASFTALIRDAFKLAEDNPDGRIAEIIKRDGMIDGKSIFEAAIAGYPDARKLTETFIEYIGAGVVNIINILDPQMIVIGGGISRSSDYFLPKLIEYARENAFCRQVKLCDIRVASKGNDAGIIGAARLGDYI